tara:strand:- start:12191 stop:12970 length:780 start_codon:yes stop_codon:yes gene_type:complete
MKMILLTLIFFSASVFPFTLNNGAGAAFKTKTIKVNVAAHACANIGITNSELLSIAKEAIDIFWNRVSTSSLELVEGSIVSVAGDFQTGQVCTGSTSNCDPTPALVVASDILISCNNNAANYSGSNEVLGVTVPNNISGSDIKGALVLVNDQAGNSFESKSHAAKVSIIAHELGHAIGLGHSPFREALMFAQFVEGRDRLAQDDENGATWLYPVEEPDLGICGQVHLHDGHQGSPGNMIIGLLFGFLLITYGRKLLPRF